jgi:putative ABC transport system substrate-binding protein
MRTLRSLVAGLLVLVGPTVAHAQPAGKIYRIGVLELVPVTSNAANLGAFRQGLRELGFVEGQNVVIEYRSADGQADRFADLASEFTRLKVDVIVTRGTPAALAAKQATSTIPIVMASSGDTDVKGIAASLGRSGGNVTGFHATAPPELGGKRLHLLKEMVPGLSRVAVLWNAGDLHGVLMVKELETVARALGVQLKSVGFRNSWEFDRVFEEALLGHVDALIVAEDYQTLTDRTRVVDFANMSRLPAIYGLSEFVDAGGLMAYGTNRRDLFRRAAVYVSRILRGAKPADLPVEQPNAFELVINLRTATTLGLMVPPSLLGRADQIVE